MTHLWSLVISELLGAFARFCCNLLVYFKVSESFDSETRNLQAFSFAKLKAATSNFSIENKLGEGGFGPVYKVKFHDYSISYRITDSFKVFQIFDINK